MTDEAALYRAILADPADDLARLLYAEELDENSGMVECPWRTGALCPYFNQKPCPTCSGSGRISDGRAARAEFIRVQVELARWGGCEWKSPRRNRSGYVECDEWNKLLGEGRVMTWCQACAKRERLRRRERELWEKYGTLWAKV